MLFSTELREPFLDYRLVEFAFSLPFYFKIKNGITKFMLREIASEYLANDLVFAPKRPLQTPQREWLAQDLKDWVADCFENIEKSKYREWFDRAVVQEELQAYFRGGMESSFHIWQCINLNIMLKKIE
jgi:asparagine synthase (glutamine-hydrolysing)